MNNKTMKELSKIALELGLTLSYKGEDGKRKRYTKPQLIELIETKQAETVKVETVETIESNIVEITPLTNKEVVQVATEQLKAGNIQIVKQLLNKLNNSINRERKNKLLVAKMSNFKNIIVAKLKQFERKGGLSHV